MSTIELVFLITTALLALSLTGAPAPKGLPVAVIFNDTGALK